MAAFVGGLAGISDSARALGTPALVKFAAMLGALMPVLQLPVLGAFAWRSQARLAELEDEAKREAARERRARRAAEGDTQRRAAPAAAAQPATRPGARAAIACVKSIVEQPADDAWLSMQFGGGQPMPADSQPLARLCGGHFVVCYLIDEGDHFRYANAADLAAAGMHLDELHPTGVRNLSALVEGRPGLRMGREGAVQALLMGGHFEASLVLLDGLWNGPLAKLAPNGAVVALPARDVCAFCDARSAEGVAQLRALAQRVSAGGDHPITPRLFQRSDGRWRPLPG